MAPWVGDKRVKAVQVDGIVVISRQRRICHREKAAVTFHLAWLTGWETLRMPSLVEGSKPAQPSACLPTVYTERATVPADRTIRGMLTR